MDSETPLILTMQMDSEALQIWRRLKACFCSSCSISEWGDCEHTDTADTWDQVTLGINFNAVNEIDHLEDDQTYFYRL